jgi:hypothetical protein
MERILMVGVAFAMAVLTATALMALAVARLAIVIFGNQVLVPHVRR